MRILPNSTLKFLCGVPLDRGYNHSIYFESKQMQQAYFERYVKMPTTWNGNYYKFVIDKQTYLRVEKGQIKVALPADLLYDVNYIMFQNTAFGSRWFYAFVTAVDYVNNETSLITFDIDELQTWFFDYELGECFVEREHTSSDEIGEHIEVENIDCGAYMQVANKKYISLSENMAVLILYNPNHTADKTSIPNGRQIDGIYVPYKMWWVKTTDRDWEVSVNNKINDIITNSGVMVAMYLVPEITLSRDAYNQMEDPDAADIEELSHKNRTITSGDYIPQRPTAFGNYIPRNKKLFTQQFCNMVVSNNSGATKTYAYERFRNIPTFQLDTLKVPQCIALLTPQNYRFNSTIVLNNTNRVDYDNAVPYDNFPQCAWSEDTYAKWWAQNKNSYAAGIVTTVGSALVSGGIGLLQGNYARTAMAGVSAIAGILDSVAKVQDTKNTPDKVSGAMNSETTNYVLNKCGFTLYAMTVTEQYAKIIDTFFQSYGYAVKVVKQPRMDNRQFWTYVKTIGCNLHAKKNIEGDVVYAIPADTEEKICSLFDNGITFWRCQHDLSCDVGNYDRDNPPIAG